MKKINLLEEIGKFSTFEYIKNSGNIILSDNFFSIINKEIVDKNILYSDFRNIIKNQIFMINNEEIEIENIATFEELFDYFESEAEGEIISHDNNMYLKWQFKAINIDGEIVEYKGIMSDVTKEQSCIKNEKYAMQKLAQNEELTNASSWELDLIRQKYWMTAKSQSTAQLSSDGVEIAVSDMEKNLPNVLIVKDGEYCKATGVVDFYGLDEVDLNKPDKIYKVMQVGLSNGDITSYFTHTYKPVISNGKIVKILGSTRDITEEKERENKLINSNIRLETTEFMTKSGSWEYDIVNQTYWVSLNLLRRNDPKALNSITIPSSVMDERIPKTTILRSGKKYHPQNLADFYNIDKIDPNYPDRIYSLIQIAIDGKNDNNCMHTTYKAIFENGNIIKLVGSSRDITEERTKENELIHAKELAEEASASQGRFVANMSHEIRTPLNAILGFSEVIKNYNSDEKLNYYIDAIDTAGNILLNIITDILDFSKVNANKFKVTYTPCNLSDFCEELKILFWRKLSIKDLDLDIIYDTELPTLELPVSIIRQIMINLIGNAVKFTSQGKITIKADCIQKNDMYNIKMSVIDTGIGIAKDKQEFIFKEFEQADESHEKIGTGLGLAISSKFAALINTSIDLKSEPGEGSIFSFEIENILPSKINVESAFSNTEEINFKFKNQKAIIIDDIKDNREVLQAHCNRLNIKSTSYYSGVDALKSLSIDKPDIILTDLRMPIMGGEELAKKIKLKQLNIPIICITASINPDERYDLKYFDDVLNKPIPSCVLAKTMAKYLDTIDINEELENLGLDKLKKSLNLIKDEKIFLKSNYLDELLKLKVGINPKKLMKVFSEISDYAIEIHNDDLEKICKLTIEYIERFDIENIIVCINTICDTIAEVN